MLTRVWAEAWSIAATDSEGLDSMSSKANSMFSWMQEGTKAQVSDYRRSEDSSSIITAVIQLCYVISRL